MSYEIEGHHVAGLLFRDEASPAKTLLVAAHGGLATKETLAAICWEARARGQDCLALDLLGHGGSSAFPKYDSFATLGRAVRVPQELAIVPRDQQRYVGHSLGAGVGCGYAYPCEHSVAIGNHVKCEHMIFGSVHKLLGLSDSFYTLSHVLEPWTPEVVDRAVTLTAGATNDSAVARARIAKRIALAWLSLAVIAGIGVAVARVVRRSARLTPFTRGLLAGGCVALALGVGSWRILWSFVPHQPSDAVIMATIMAASCAAAYLARGIGLQSARWGALAAAIITEIVAMILFAGFAPHAIQMIVILMTFLMPVASIPVLLAERVSRGKGSDPVEGAAFVAMILGLMAALLFPS